MDLKLNTLSFWVVLFWVVLRLWYLLVVILMSYALIIDWAKKLSTIVYSSLSSMILSFQ